MWAPYHYWIVDYFRRVNRETEAINIAERLVNSVYVGWLKSNYIYEKYHADTLGEYGGGGEYVVQEGFGWTNGTVIKFMDWFGDNIKLACGDYLTILESITEINDTFKLDLKEEDEEQIEQYEEHSIKEVNEDQEDEAKMQE